MNKRQENIKRVLNLLTEKGYISTTQLGKDLGVTTVSAFLYVRELLEKGLIERIGQGKNTRYGIRKYENKNLDYSILSDVIEILIESGFEGNDMTTREGIENLLLAHFAFVSPGGLFLAGFEAFLAWCIDPKRKYNDKADQVRELVYWLTRYYELEVLRRKHGFFDGTKSLKEVLEHIMEVFVDTLLFHDIVEISGFGKTKIAWELYLGKQNSDQVLLERAIAPSIRDIKKYVQDKKIDALIFTPPTIPRSTQFRDVLRDMLKVDLFEIGVSKTVLPDRVLRAQKTLK
jgi:predicted transcriptional regulator